MRAQCVDMDGEVIRAGDRAICLALPEKQPCVVKVLEVTPQGKLKVSNGRVFDGISGAACILQAHA